MNDDTIIVPMTRSQRDAAHRAITRSDDDGTALDELVAAYDSAHDADQRTTTTA